MKKTISAIISIIMISAFAIASFGQEAPETDASDFYRELEGVVSDVTAQDEQEPPVQIPEDFPGFASPSFLWISGDTQYILDDGTADPTNGIILQMIDEELPEEGINNNDGAYKFHIEEAGFPMMAYSPVKDAAEENPDDNKETNAAENAAADSENAKENAPGTDADAVKGSTVLLNISSGEYEGDVCNGTGYYFPAGDVLKVDIAEDAVLNGDISLTSYIHGIMLKDLNVDDVIKAIDLINGVSAEDGGAEETNSDAPASEPAGAGTEEAEAGSGMIDYVFINSRGEVTDSKEDAAALQFTKFPAGVKYLPEQVINMVNYNGLGAVEVTVSGTWNVKSASLVTYLEVKEKASVNGEIMELADGSLLIIASEKTIKPGKYGKQK